MPLPSSPPPSPDPLPQGSPLQLAATVPEPRPSAVPPRASQAAVESTSQSISPLPSSSGTQHAVRSTGGAPPQGSSSHEAACTIVPASAAHSASVATSSHSASLSSSWVALVQHTSSSPLGGLTAQGLGRQESTACGVPPAAVHSSAVRSSHSTSPSSPWSLRQQATDAGSSDGMSPTRTSSPSS